jgi:hypothetical protein
LPVVHTTSHPPRHSRDKDANTSREDPIKSIRLRVEFFGAGGGDLKRLAGEKGLTILDQGGKVSLVVMSTTPEDALAKLVLLKGLFASKS